MGSSSRLTLSRKITLKTAYTVVISFVIHKFQEMNNILSEIEKIHNKCNNAMVFLTVSSQINITYSDIFTLSKELCKKILNVCKNFERNSCMALVMTHNPYILPIVIR